MTHPSPVTSIIRTIWAILILYWTVSAFGNKKPKIRQDRGSRVAYVLVLLVASFFISSQKGLRHPLFHASGLSQATGVLVCAAGAAVAIRARRILGRNWSGLVTIKQDHELIQSGPYRYVRHPIYTGLILAITGTMFALNPTVEGLLIALLWTVAFYVKSRHEEHVLTREFGDQYATYKSRVKAALIPRLF
jgi:protein-S-isoprenylcysteine O-methyltransferase Ste14